MNTFSFPVGGHLAARRAVFWPQLPKIALFGSKNDVFGPKLILFGYILQIVCYYDRPRFFPTFGGPDSFGEQDFGAASALKAQYSDL